jgi:branched-chain amino acid transport system substrate-binding protein
MKRFVYPAASAALLLSGVMAVNVSAQGAHSRAAAGVTYQLCTSTPYGVPATRVQSQGIRNGVALAVYQYRSKLAKAGVKIGPIVNMDDAKADGSNYDPNVEHANAIACASNKHTLGFVGPLNSGAALAGEPVTNRAHLVQISPANTNPELTSLNPYQGAGGRASQEPATYNHSIPWVTYYRTVTTDALQGPTGAAYAKNTLKATSFYLVDDKTTYGAGLATTFAAYAKKIGMKQVGVGHIDSSSTAAEAQTSQAIATKAAGTSAAMVYCGCNPQTSAALPKDLRNAGYTKPVMGGDGIVTPSWITGAGTRGASNNYATNVGPPASKASKNFVKLYKKYFPGFYRNPGIQSYDATSYDAAGIILTAIWKAARAHQLKGNLTHKRTMVVKYVHSIHYCGATGCMTFDSNGDTSNRILTMNAVHGSAWVFLAELQAPAGIKPT